MDVYGKRYCGLQATLLSFIVVNDYEKHSFSATENRWIIDVLKHQFQWRNAFGEAIFKWLQQKLIQTTNTHYRSMLISLPHLIKLMKLFGQIDSNSTAQSVLSTRSHIKLMISFRIYQFIDETTGSIQLIAMKIVAGVNFN